MKIEKTYYSDFSKNNFFVFRLVKDDRDLQLFNK